MTTAVFPFGFHPLFAAAALPLGVRHDTCHVQVADDGLSADFGSWRVRTPLSNIVAASVTGPYSWPKVIGPPHLSLSDRGLTFATNPDEGVCIRFARPVTGIDPWGVVRHPALTVTVAEPAALAELLDRDDRREDRVHVHLDEPSVAELIDAAHDELMSLSAAELRRRARDRGIVGVSRRSKAELVALLEPVGPGPEAAVDGA